ncbi:MAG: hypothetical protein SGPRY_010066 [Prymnesium sp.]
MLSTTARPLPPLRVRCVEQQPTPENGGELDSVKVEDLQASADESAGEAAEVNSAQRVCSFPGCDGNGRVLGGVRAT